MDKIKEWLRTYALVLIAGVAGLGFVWWQGRQAPADFAPVAASSSWEATSSAASASGASASSKPSAGFVYLQGAVVHPGLYPVDGTTRWDAVVKAAGGLTKDADTSTVNLAAIANDQESLLIPVHGDAAPATAPAPQAAAGSASTTLVNLNTATEAELQTLSGIGPKKAADIIAYRDANGGFKTVDELLQVSGIGEKTLEALKDSVTVGP